MHPGFLSDLYPEADLDNAVRGDVEVGGGGEHVLRQEGEELFPEPGDAARIPDDYCFPAEEERYLLDAAVDPVVLEIHNYVGDISGVSINP